MCNLENLRERSGAGLVGGRREGRGPRVDIDGGPTANVAFRDTNTNSVTSCKLRGSELEVDDVAAVDLLPHVTREAVGRVCAHFAELDSIPKSDCWAQKTHQ